MKRFEMAFLTCSMVLLMFSSLNASAQQTKPKEKDAVAYDVPHVDEVIIHKDIPYLKTPDSALKMDIYYPPKFNFNSKIPAVVFVYAYTNDGQLKAVGKQFRKWIAYTSWCRVVAASGMAAIAYETVNPENDLNALMQYVKTNADKLNIDANKIGAYAGSANTTTALAYILNDTNSILKCAAIYYGIFLCTDFKHLSLMDTLSQNMGFVTPRLSEPVSWNKKVPLMIVHVGKDFVPHSDESLIGFVDKAINQKVPFTLIHYATGIHGFDVWADDETTRQIIKTTFDFWKFYLK